MRDMCSVKGCTKFERWRNSQTCHQHRPIFDRPAGQIVRLAPYKAAPASAPLPKSLQLLPLEPLRIDDYGGWTSNGAATRAG